MSIFKCKMCGGALEIGENQTVAVCEYCGTQQTLPKLDTDRRANLYDRANHFRRNDDFDKAADIYEQILNEDRTDAEAYWSLVLCRYGIEYVEDPATRKRVPTVNRAQFTSVFDDDNYICALRYADPFQRRLYKDEAQAINEIQKSILTISQQEKPFDVFICYKETDSNGRRTRDSVLATELYHELVEEGLLVFFSRITLENRLGQEYEPYIFAALHSAKVMVVLGTRPEYFNAVWVKNEWSRFLALIKSGAKKVLIPAYRDMDPYELPEEFSHLQAQDMAKLGFMQDLIHGIKKLVEPATAPTPSRETVILSGAAAAAGTAPLLRRVSLFLEDGDWTSADEYCERVLDADPESAEAYVGKLMAQFRCRRRRDLNSLDEPFDKNGSYLKALRFGDEALADELRGYNRAIRSRIEQRRNTQLYFDAVNLVQRDQSLPAIAMAIRRFESIPGFRNADTLAERCRAWYELRSVENRLLVLLSDRCEALECAEREQARARLQAQREREEAQRKRELDAAFERKRLKEKRARRNGILAVFGLLACAALYFLFTETLIPGFHYHKAEQLMAEGAFEQSIESFRAADDYSDAADRILEVHYAQAEALLQRGDLLGAIESIRAASDYKDAADRILGVHYAQAEALLQRGDLLGAAMQFGAAQDFLDSKERSLALWSSFVRHNSIAAGGYHTVARRANGTVVATGYAKQGQCSVSDWTDIISVAAGTNHTVGLKTDGTVVAVGDNESGQCSISDWTDILSIAAGAHHTIGLKTDGTVVAVGNNKDGQCDVSGWTDIVAIAAGFRHTVGLKADGTVVAVGDHKNGRCDVSEWTDITAICAGYYHTVGLRADGTVFATGYKNDAQCNVSGWEDIVAIAAGFRHTVGLKADGTVIAVGDNRNGQCDVLGWTDIVAIAACNLHTVGLRADGTVVAVGENEDRQCSVSDWTDVVAAAAGD